MVSYAFKVNNTRAHIKLIGLCILFFLLLFTLFLVGLGTELVSGYIGIATSLVILVICPIVLFYIKRKNATEMVTVQMDKTHLEIHWPKHSITILFSEIKSYSADFIEGDESASVESVRIRLKDGRKIRLYATDTLGDIKPLGKFREDFSALAKELNLKYKYFSW